MTRFKILSALSVLCVLISPRPVRAQSREQMQMLAEMRMLQDQLSKAELNLNQIVTQIADQLKTTNKKLDDLSTSTTNSLANVQTKLADNTTTITAIREKVEAESTRVLQLAGDITPIRNTLDRLTQQLNTMTNIIQPPANLDQTAAAGTAPPTAAGPLGTVAAAESPSKLYQQANSDYMANRLDNAIAGFEEYLSKWPNGPQAADSQFNIAQSYFNKRNWPEALKAFTKVVSDYKSSDWVPDAMYNEGLVYQQLKQTANAQRIYEALTKQYPESSAAARAQQELGKIKNGGRD